MIEYPPDFPESAKAAVEHALADAEARFADFLFQEVALLSSPVGDPHRPSISFVTRVFEEFLWQVRAVAVDQHWTATRLREVASASLERLIVSVFREKHPQRWPPSLDAFRAAVHQQLRKFPFWTRDYQDMLRELSAQAAQQPASRGAHTSDLPHATNQLTQRAAWLQNKLDHGTMTLAGIKKVGGPDRKTTKKILAAVPVGENVLRRLADALRVNRAEIP